MKTVICMLCKQSPSRNKCINCGALVCNNCFNNARGICVACLRGKTIKR